MTFADISAAFLQGDYLPEERRMFVKCPRNLPSFCTTVSGKQIASRGPNRPYENEKKQVLALQSHRDCGIRGSKKEPNPSEDENYIFVLVSLPFSKGAG